MLSPLSPIVHIAGARPNFPKAAPVIAALKARGIPQVLVHTGQHYDERLSEVFLRQLGLPEPDVNLGVGSGSHAEQTAAVMVGLEPLLRDLDPALVVVYGDVNSTLAASVVAAKLLAPVAHVEAGLRSFDVTMPEEINRRLTDQLCELLFVTSPEAIGYLANEGVDVGRIHFVGNPMIDTLLANLHRFDAGAARESLGLPERYAVATLHRPSNVDSPDTAAELVRALHEIADEVDLVIPLHPRGRAVLEEVGLRRHPRIHVHDPIGYVEFISLVRGAVAVLTDSGGVQEETTVLGVPCLTMRPNTERPITITHGTNQLVTTGELVRVFKKVLQSAGKEDHLVPPLWDGQAGPRIARVIVEWLERGANEQAEWSTRDREAPTGSPAEGARRRARP
jgi:UDP-N-acetylglucosamine 2-epimerase